ncbi:orf107 [Sucra jujuba nucleopolyhedrovirus]|uniref:Orf107 n=1 Tax=Sucra jujuba nucleopolyhedrovirus TaxID=1563660 RepID=A0A097P941_9ABAC|nr:orf107 [Sucra jujuba nucleopolyhedrovirus]AIU41346.1 orf107 [Sucra jujuba nucleopolyhedrovirus]
MSDQIETFNSQCELKKHDVSSSALEAGYLEYYAAVQQIIKFVKGFVKDKDQYTYVDYKEFATTLIKLLGDLVDDYMSGNFNLFATASNSTTATPSVETADKLTEMCHKLEVDLAETKSIDFDTLNKLVELLQKNPN